MVAPAPQAPNISRVKATTEPEQLEIVKQDDSAGIDQFEIKPMTVSSENLQKYLEDYYTKIESVIAKSNNEPGKTLELTNDGYDRHYVQIIAHNKIYGLAILNYDQTALGGHRCYIRHFSTV